MSKQILFKQFKVIKSKNIDQDKLENRLKLIIPFLNKRYNVNISHLQFEYIKDDYIKGIFTISFYTLKN